ncbi:BCLAF1 and THRAP3 family member 3 [Gastrophryne carolinensis]
MHNNNEFKTVRRWGSFHRPHNTDRDWHENDGHWSERDHSNQYWSPPRRPDFEERKPFQKRYPEDDYREYDQPYKRLREADRHNLQPHRSPYWKDDHPDEPYGKGWTKEFDHRHSNFILHERQSEHVAKIESDYRHRSPRYIRAEPVFSDDHVSRSKLHEEQKLSHARTSQSHKTDRDDHERRRYNERSSQPLSKCSSRKDNGGNGVKSDTDINDNNAPATEFTQEIITIIHEVKANHFKASGMSLHERFSKMQTESNTQELNFDKPPLQINPEIHRRIDISLEDLKKKSLHKTVDIQSVKHKIIEDPNDLRHDIERRRKERLHSNKDESPNDHFDKRYHAD